MNNKSSTDTVLSATEHTPTPWTTSALRPFSVNKGTVTVEADKPHNRWVIKRVWRDEQNRRCTKFVAEAYSEADAALIVEAVNSYATLQSELTRAREREKEVLAALKLARAYLVKPATSNDPFTAEEATADLEKIDAALAGGKP